MARQLPKVKVAMTAHGRGKVFIDDVEIAAPVSALRLRATADKSDTNRLDLELVVGEVEFEGPAEVVMHLRDQLPKLTVRPRPAPTSEPSTGDDSPPV